MRAIDVARYFLALADEDAGDLVSNLKLQKLLYYAQGFHLAMTGRPLFDEPIQAWTHGPVVPAVYHEFKRYGSGPIPATEAAAGNPTAIDPETLEVLNEVYSAYGQFSAWKLRNLTHDEPPWKDTPSGSEISHQSLKSFFSQQLVV